jgi:RNA polymerase sigma factor (TIGR02999 family)
MSAVSQILDAIARGVPQAADELLPLVYEELRQLAAQKLAHEPAGQTLQPTALVHEAYLRLVDPENTEPHWNGRRHFFGAAAEAMRRILIERARRKGRVRHGGGRRRVELDERAFTVCPEPDDLLVIDEALTRLAAEDPESANLVNLRFYGGLSVEEAANVLGMSRTSAYRQWDYARAWLRCAIADAGPE